MYGSIPGDGRGGQGEHFGLKGWLSGRPSVFYLYTVCHVGGYEDIEGTPDVQNRACASAFPACKHTIL